MPCSWPIVLIRSTVLADCCSLVWPNGWTDPYTGTGEAFTGLLNSGSLLEELLATWPEQLATALGESTAVSASSLSADLVPDLLSSL
jgi:hypothetical protein